MCEKTRMPFSELFVDATKQGIKLQTASYLREGRYPIIDQGQEQIAGYTDEVAGVFDRVPCIVFGDHTRIIKYIDQPFFLGADGVKVLCPKAQKDNVKYLFYALQTVKIPDTGYNRHFKWLKESNIVVYSSEQQDRIVATLDKIEKLISLRKKQLQKLDDLIKSRFAEMFGDMVLNPNGWEKANLGSVCDVRDGTHDSPKYFTDGYPLVTSKNVTSGRIDFTGCCLICEEDYNKINERSKVDFGDILMPMIGTVGKPVIVDIDTEFAIKNVALIKFYVNSKVINTFVKALLQSDYFDRAVISKIRGGTQKFIALGDIRKLEICLPPMETQLAFRAIVEQGDKSKLTIQQGLDKLEQMKQTLMQKYFG